MSGCAEAVIDDSFVCSSGGAEAPPYPKTRARARPTCLSQANSIELIPRRHVRQHHLVALAQAVQHLDRVDRALAELHLDARRLAGRRIELEEADRALLLAERGAPNRQDVV